ncbi:hypothetical protein D9611_009758 [Ephemerocybe angulata]|uniref:Uncharacterized protein n=1 Tax=Ephemerocybe angulata TaxID=980116 RepID=A0A8H5CD03_9AGAR|nr:hypothetical protein D9611_009758 [Tulosesus angulatus]
MSQGPIQRKNPVNSANGFISAHQRISTLPPTAQQSTLNSPKTIRDKQDQQLRKEEYRGQQTLSGRRYLTTVAIDGELARRAQSAQQSQNKSAPHD